MILLGILLRMQLKVNPPYVHWHFFSQYYLYVVLFTYPIFIFATSEIKNLHCIILFFQKEIFHHNFQESISSINFVCLDDHMLNTLYTLRPDIISWCITDKSFIVRDLIEFDITINRSSALLYKLLVPS